MLALFNICISYSTNLTHCVFVLEWNCLCLHADCSDRISKNGQLVAINNVTNKNKCQKFVCYQVLRCNV